MLNNSGRAPQFMELLHKKSSNAHCDRGLKSFANSSGPGNDSHGSEGSYTKSSSSVQPGGSENLLDFLTGDFNISKSHITDHTSFDNGEQTNFLDDGFDVNPFAPALKVPVPEVNNQVEECGSTQLYLQFFETLSAYNKVSICKKITLFRFCFLVFSRFSCICVEHSLSKKTKSVLSGTCPENYQ